ncbi:MAG: hypothetical protein CVU46_17535 [Chloroflexi bacterium HGW-Chloroflexi-8]|nr:MAG: hypothetical protein CVU46_17535 [Chloroflexi bacterium HGW-Chloroflexi-8]
MQELITYLPLLVIAGASLILFLNVNWRWNVIALSLQYVGVFWMVLSFWPVGLAAVKLVSGWMAGAIIGTTISDSDNDKNFSDSSPKEEIRFRIVLWIVIMLVIFALIPGISLWIPISNQLLIGSFLLIVIGLLQLSMTIQSYRIIFGLLTVLSGFEIVYAGLEDSVLVAGFLSIITLGIAFIGVFVSHKKNEENSI